MRINKYIASATGLGRRAVDGAITSGRVTVNGAPAVIGQVLSAKDRVSLDGRILSMASPGDNTLTIMLNKPRGYVVSRKGQGSKTIYDLLPSRYQFLKPIGRLDKNSSGLLLLTNDGQLAFELTHPSHRKQKVYEITLDKPLQPQDQQQISHYGIALNDGLSKLQLEQTASRNSKEWRVTMREGRNRQIRRTFQRLGYRVTQLHRTNFGAYLLGTLPTGKSKEV